MILQALKEYYDRKPDLPRQGWEMKAIPFLVVINTDGRFVGFQDTRENNDAKQFLVPALGEKKGRGIKSNLFWENIEYMLGIPVPTKAKPNPNIGRVKMQHLAFRKKIESVIGDHPFLIAARNFATIGQHSSVERDPLWPEVLKTNQILLLSMQAMGPLTDNSEVRTLVDVSHKASDSRCICLVTGNEDEMNLLEPPIKGVRDANTSGACLVGFQKYSGYDSFGKKQGTNAPIGKSASFAYTTALNTLLRKNSPQKLQIGDATTVFWSAQPTKLETDVFFFFNAPPKGNPDRNTDAVKSIYASIWNGSYVIPDDNTLFYLLGLAPNSARIAVRFWEVDTVSKIGRRLQQHVKDLAIVNKDHNSSLPLRNLLRSVAAQHEDKNIPSNLAGNTVRSIIEGLPYPQTLLQCAIRRIKAEQASNKKTGKSAQNVTYERAALIKACINRSMRFNNHNYEKEITMSLDTTNTNVGYRLGRLFAVLERIKERANPGNATICDHFYGAASETPVTVFGNLMRLKNHHLSKLKNAGERINLEKLIGEIMSEIYDFPARLPLANQGRFAIGYYHQKQDFFTKKTDK